MNLKMNWLLLKRKRNRFEGLEHHRLEDHLQHRFEGLEHHRLEDHLQHRFEGLEHHRLEDHLQHRFNLNLYLNQLIVQV
ncbi:hypothetical protein containing NLQ[I/L] tandem repeats [Invertebrate iridescent virus 22]|uniref:Uncharacterized protein n=1 Tax=Invertebrate iridescent virus 22 TaxID=345198 RepID=W8W198_9VIRU|nr:hypothetical protein containing NLQ[I/L] tandem repeats [Invertebrate iridescent virus 22]CCV01857.1 hypothetical protein containing NLQ[I/L] tandem repeats [Invertebrate iridescent virus 22]